MGAFDVRIAYLGLKSHPNTNHLKPYKTWAIIRKKLRIQEHGFEHFILEQSCLDHSCCAFALQLHNRGSSSYAL